MLLPLVSGLLTFIYLLLRRIPNIDINPHYSTLVTKTQDIVFAYILFSGTP